MRKTIFLLSLIVSFFAKGQGFYGIIAKQEGNNIQIQYNLKSTEQGYLGVLYQPLTPELIKTNKIRKVNQGAFVSAVNLGSPALMAGIRAGDIITKIDDVKVKGANDLSDYISKKKVNEAVRLTLNREGEAFEKQVLLGENPTSYFIKVYSSLDQYQWPLKDVTGDVGTGIRAGDSKNIMWLASREIEGYEGEITFELRAAGSDYIDHSSNAFFQPGNIYNNTGKAPLVITSPALGSKLKLGKKYDISWSGGEPSARYNAELYQNNKVVSIIASNVSNGSNIKWKVPRNTVVGPDYSVRLLTAENSELLAASPNFRIKRNNNFLNITLSVLLIATVVLVQL